MSNWAPKTEAGYKAMAEFMKLQSGQTQEKHMTDYSKVLRRDFKIPQFDRGAKHLMKGERGDGSDYWLFTCSMVSQCSPLFDSCWDNHDVARRLKKAGVIDDSCEEDGEASQMYVNFKSESDGLAFLDRLNKYLVKKTEIVREAAAY